MKKQVTELKKAMQVYITAKKACDEAETEMEFKESDEAEKAFDLTYKKQFNAYIDVSKKLSSLIGISETDARSLVNTKESEVVALIEKLGA